MPNMILIAIFCLLFTALTWHRFRIGLFFLFLLLPTYLIRFSIGPLPMTLLEIMIWIVFVVWVIQEGKKTKKLESYKSLILNNRSLFIAIGLFLIGATISVFTAVDLRAAAGEWKAFYVEPVLLFIVLVTSLTKTKISNLKTIIYALVLLGLATGVLATIQHFTGWMVPWDFWENGGSYRVTGWYGFPNGVGLFLAPLALLSLYLLFENIFSKLRTHSSYFVLFSSALAFIFSLLGIIFAKSTGGLIGVIAGVGLLLAFYKKTRWPVIVLGVVAILGVFSLPAESPVRQELLAQNRSGQLRVDMWAEATQYISEHPVTGAGLASYSKEIYPYRVDKWIEVFHHPHNLFLTMWVNVGLIGLIGFIWVLVWFYRVGLTWSIKNGSWNNLLPMFLMAAMASILVTGLVDSPYIKNDYSVLFWFLIAAMFISVCTQKES